MTSYDQIKSAHTQRKKESLRSSLVKERGEALFLTSPSDIGVCRNGGRRGSSFGPQAILNTFLRCTLPEGQDTSPASLEVKAVSSQEAEELSFSQGQQQSLESITKALLEFSGSHVIHLGGGHDHIYPLLMGIEQAFDYQHLKILNIDAHLDTRIDDFPHSGTPFRQFAEQTDKDLTLYQLGIHPYSNSASTYTPLPKGEMVLLEEQKTLEKTLAPVFSLSTGDLLVLSLDCDALDASFMEGVSAVNHHGMKLDTLLSIGRWYQELEKQVPSLIGVYEYNPLFDNLSQKGARSLSAFLYHVLYS